MVAHQGAPPWQEKNWAWSRKVNLKSRKDVGRRCMEKDSRTKSVGKIFKKLANRCADLERSKSKQAAQLSLMRTKIERLEDILAKLQSPSMNRGSAVDSPSQRKVEAIPNATNHRENSKDTGIGDFVDTATSAWMKSANPLSCGRHFVEYMK